MVYFEAKIYVEMTVWKKKAASTDKIDYLVRLVSHSLLSITKSSRRDKSTVSSE